MNTISFVCRVISKDTEPNFYKVAVSSKSHLEVPYMTIDIERKVKCENNLLEDNKYYIIWNSKISEDKTYVEVATVTYLSLYSDYHAFKITK